MKTVQAIFILACARHARGVLQILDDAGMGDWTEVPAIQARRLGYLQNVSGRHPDTCRIICGFAESVIVEKVLAELEDARVQGEVCTECAVYTWEVKQALSSHVAMDLVCREVVDCASAPSAEYDGTVYYFASEENRDIFLRQPDVYVQRYNVQRIGRRDRAALVV